jgi:hypothetical protein
MSILRSRRLSILRATFIVRAIAMMFVGLSSDH